MCPTCDLGPYESALCVEDGRIYVFQHVPPRIVVPVAASIIVEAILIHLAVLHRSYDFHLVVLSDPVDPIEPLPKAAKDLFSKFVHALSYAHLLI